MASIFSRIIAGANLHSIAHIFSIKTNAGELVIKLSQFFFSCQNFQLFFFRFFNRKLFLHFFRLRNRYFFFFFFKGFRLRWNNFVNHFQC